MSAALTIAILVINGSFSTAQASTGSQACSLKSEGIYQGAWVKHRIYLNDDVVYGANDMDSIIVQLQSLREVGICR